MISAETMEDTSCCCHDNQAVFLERAMRRLNLNSAQQQLLLQSFREVSVKFPSESMMETSKHFAHLRATGCSTTMREALLRADYVSTPMFNLKRSGRWRN